MDRTAEKPFFRQMKKTALIIAFLLVFTAPFFSSCNDDGPDYPEIDLIYGRWKVVNMRQNEDSPWSAWNYEETYLTFNANGQFVAQGYYGTGSGLWNSDKSIISATLNNGTQLRFRILEGKAGSDLVLRTTNLYGTIDLRLVAANIN